MATDRQTDQTTVGQESYRRWRGRLLADPEGQRLYEEEAAKGERWLRRAEARQAAGPTQAELAKGPGESQA
jgi:hypothetical protein